MGQAALPAVKKRRTVAKPAEHLGGIPSSQVYHHLCNPTFCLQASAAVYVKRTARLFLCVRAGNRPPSRSSV